MLDNNYDLIPKANTDSIGISSAYMTFEDAYSECMEYISSVRSSSQKKESNFDISESLAKDERLAIFRDQNSRYISEYVQSKQPLVSNGEDRCYTSPELITRLKSEINEYGILSDYLLRDDTIDEIRINGYRDILIQVKGFSEPLYDPMEKNKRVEFSSPKACMNFINRLLMFSNVSIKESDNGAVATGSTPEGFRVTAVGTYAVSDEQGANKNIYQKSPYAVIRKHSSVPIPMEHLVGYNSLADDMAKFIQLCGKYKINLGFFGDLNSGKTTLLQSALDMTDDKIRKAVLERAPELKCRKLDAEGYQINDCTPMEYKDFNGTAPTYGNTLENLMATVLRLSPQIVVFGEILKDEEFSFVKQATSTMAVMFTGHSTSVTQACYKMTDACLAASPGQTRESVLNAICASMDIIVISSGMKDGSRKVTTIGEVLGTELVDGMLRPKVNILYEYKQLGFHKDSNKVYGYHIHKNNVSMELLHKMERTGMDIEDIQYLTKPIPKDTEEEHLLYNGYCGEYENIPEDSSYGI